MVWRVSQGLILAVAAQSFSNLATDSKAPAPAPHSLAPKTAVDSLPALPKVKTPAPAHAPASKAVPVPAPKVSSQLASCAAYRQTLQRQIGIPRLESQPCLTLLIQEACQVCKSCPACLSLPLCPVCSPRLVKRPGL